MGELIVNVDSWAALWAMFRLFPAEMAGLAGLAVSALLIACLVVSLAVCAAVGAVRRASALADALLGGDR